MGPQAMPFHAAFLVTLGQPGLGTLKMGVIPSCGPAGSVVLGN